MHRGETEYQQTSDYINTFSRLHVDKGEVLPQLQRIIDKQLYLTFGDNNEQGADNARAI